MYITLQRGVVPSVAYSMYLLMSLWSLKRLWSNLNPFPCPLECRKCHSTPWSAKPGITAALEILEKSGAAELQHTEHSSGVNDWRTDTCLNPAYDIMILQLTFLMKCFEVMSGNESWPQNMMISKNLTTKKIHIETYNYTLLPIWKPYWMYNMVHCVFLNC